jgi:cytochrome P450
MSEAEVAVQEPRVRPHVAVDPALLAVIGDPAAPRRGMPVVRPPDSLPGKLGFWAALMSLYRSLRYGARYVEEVRAELGDFTRGMNPTVPSAFISDPEEVLKILRNEDELWSSGMGWETAFFDRLEEGHDNSGLLLSLDFDRHRAARKLLQPAFSSKAVRGYIEIASRGFAASVPGWIERGQVDFKPAARVLLSRVANAIFTGIEDPAEVAHLDRALTAAWLGPQALSDNPRFSPALRKARIGFKTLKEYFVALAPARRATPGDDLFSQLCQGQDDSPASDEALVRLFITVLIAAYDTTSCAVTSMAYLLAKHPEWQERLRAEALAVPEHELDMAGLSRLEQLEWTWKETLRLMPVTVWVPRRNLRDVVVGGHHLAAGTFVGVVNGTLGRHAGWWREPLRFDPERFSPARAEDKRHPGLYMPFGGGAHACLGLQLAGIEAKLLFHRLLTSCRFSLVTDYEAEHTFSPLGVVSGKVALRLTPL